MKKFLKAFMAVIVLYTLVGCGQTSYQKLEGKDLIAYNLMLEVCKVSSDPTKVSVISGTVVEDIGAFRVSYNNGEQIYNILVYEEDGYYVAERMYDSVASAYKDLLYETDDFDASKVNRALRQKWGN